MTLHSETGIEIPTKSLEPLDEVGNCAIDIIDQRRHHLL